MNRETTCTFTGHRPDAFSFGYNEEAASCRLLKATLKMHIVRAIGNGFSHFVSGMAQGVDLWCAEIVAELKREYPKITLEAAIPYEGHGKGWAKEQKARYEKVLAACDKVSVISPRYTRYCMHERNRYMIDHASLCIAVYNGSVKGGTAYTVRYAKEQGVFVRIINAGNF